MNNLMEIADTIKSTELVDIINTFRKGEGNRTELQHNDFMKKIRKEVEILKNLGLRGQGNFSSAKYLDEQGKNRECFELNRDGMLEMLNSESAYVRYKTIEYINKLEEELKQPKDSYMIEDPIKRARSWIKEQEERLQLKEENKKLKPIAEFGSVVASSDDTILVREYSKILQSKGIKMPEMKMWAWLVKNEFLYKRRRYAGSDGRVRYSYIPYADTVKRGLMKSSEHPYMSKHHGPRINSIAKITGKGQQVFFNLIVKDLELKIDENGSAINQEDM